MPNQLYPDNIYLQGNLRLTEKRTVRDDARISSRGNSRNPGPTQRPNNSIPLKEWIQEQFDNNNLDVPCGCEPDSIGVFVPQACVKFKKSPTLYRPFSCSSTVLPETCEKSYKIFSSTDVELFEGNIEDAYTFILDSEDLETAVGYKIIEYITCENDSSESTDACFERYLIQVGPSVLVRIKPSCKCCEHIFETFSDIINWDCGQDCLQINFATLFDSNMDEPANVVIESVINNDVIVYTMTQNIDLPLIYEFCPTTQTGTIVFNYYFEDGNGNQLGDIASVTINIDCI